MSTSVVTTCGADAPAVATLDGGWSLGEAAFTDVVRRFRAVGARSLLEFGSGASTVRLAQALPAARIVTVEHDPRFHGRTVELLREHGLEERVDVLFAPLGYVRLVGRRFYSYLLELPQRRYDAVLIDGPPGYLMTGRQACLHHCWPLLVPGALVVLDDYAEPRERRSAERWRSVYPGAFIETEVRVGHGLLVLEKLRPMEPAPPTPLDLLANLADNVRSLAWRGRHALGQLRRRDRG